MSLVQFRSYEKRLLLHFKPEEWKPSVDGSKIFVIPAKLLTFENGQYSTEKQEEIDFIRNTRAYKRGRITEITAKDERILAESRQRIIRGPVGTGTFTEEKADPVPPAPEPQENIRGPVSAEQIQKEAGVTPGETEPRLQVAEKNVTVCPNPECGKKFEDDPKGNRLRMHMVSHRENK